MARRSFRALRWVPAISRRRRLQLEEEITLESGKAEAASGLVSFPGAHVLRDQGSVLVEKSFGDSGAIGRGERGDIGTKEVTKISEGTTLPVGGPTAESKTVAGFFQVLHG